MARKNLFWKLDCSQAYQYLQMAERQSIKVRAYNFASGTFAYRTSTQGIISSIFELHPRKHRSNHQSHQCAQYVDDIGIDANTPHQLIKNQRAVFQ